MKLYNGCPCDELAELLVTEESARDEIRNMGYIITYFPLEGGYYLAYAKTYKPIGELFNSKQTALKWLLSTNLQAKK